MCGRQVVAENQIVITVDNNYCKRDDLFALSVSTNYFVYTCDTIHFFMKFSSLYQKIAGEVVTFYQWKSKTKCNYSFSAKYYSYNCAVKKCNLNWFLLVFFLLWFTVTFRVSRGPSFDLHQRLPLYSFHFPQYLFQQKHLGKRCKRWKTKTIEVTKGRNNSVRTRISQIAQATKNTATSSSETLRTHDEAKHCLNKPIEKPFNASSHDLQNTLMTYSVCPWWWCLTWFDKTLNFIKRASTQHEQNKSPEYQKNATVVSQAPNCSVFLSGQF